MRVWVYPEKEWQDFGAKRWEVEWYTVKAKALARVKAAEDRGEQDEFDPDVDIVSHHRTFPHRAKGLARCVCQAYGER